MTGQEGEKEDGGLVLTRVLGVIMITTGPDLGTMREEEETTDHSRGQILVLDTVDELEIIDQHLQGETEALPEEDLEEITREEEITEYIPQTEMINQDPKKEIDPSSLHTIKEGPQVVLEAVTMVEMGRETKEKVVKEETIIGVSARKEGTTENETMIEEEEEKVKNKKAKRASLDAFGADQRIIWLSSAPSTRSVPQRYVEIVSLNIPPPNVEPGANQTILN